jgi:hypothetical protein
LNSEKIADVKGRVVIKQQTTTFSETQRIIGDRNVTQTFVSSKETQTRR